MSGADSAEAAWADACLAAALLATDPAGLGGLCLTARHGPVRDRWLALLADLWPTDAPLRRLPVTTADDRLLGGLDIGATLAAGRPIVASGVLAEADGGGVLLPMAERAEPRLVGPLVAALDTGRLAVERDGMTGILPAQIGVVALDESDADEPGPPDALRDRLALHADLSDIPIAAAIPASFTRADVLRARAHLAEAPPPIDDDALRALTNTAACLGIGSLRAPILALRTARALRALLADSLSDAAAAELAARLVLAPRARCLPAEGAPDQPEEAPPVPEEEGDDAAEALQDGTLADRVLDAALAALPPGLLAQLAAAAATPTARGPAGRAGAQRRTRERGRSIGSRPGRVGEGRVDLIATLQAAVPWQRLRGARSGGLGRPGRLAVRPQDIRLARRKGRSASATIFVVDASGSAAATRLAEAKGAVELLLADAYVRRDRVALIAFRGERAEVLLPPTAAPALAKRRLADLPGGGATPLASGLASAHLLARALRHDGVSPALVLLTDGRANIALSGAPGRTEAMADALALAGQLHADRLPALVVDTSPRPRAEARTLAERLGAAYLPLPRADAQALSRAAKAASPAA